MMELAESTNTKNQLAERYQRNLSLINRNEDAIVVRLSSSGIPAKIYFEILELDRKINIIRRNVGLTITFEEAKAKEKKVKELVAKIWNEMQKIIPYFMEYTPAQWRDFNDSRDIKKMLIEQSKTNRNVKVFVPRTEETAQMVIALRILGQKRIEYANKGNLENVEKIVKFLVGVAESIKQLNEQFRIKVNTDGQNID